MAGGGQSFGKPHLCKAAIGSCFHNMRPTLMRHASVGHQHSCTLAGSYGGWALAPLPLLGVQGRGCSLIDGKC